MTTVIFVHGISVREPMFSEMFKHIEGELKSRLPNIKVAPCFWGGSFGARLNAEGSSIPLYDSTKGSKPTVEPDKNTIRWMQLYQDPLYELRLLSLKTSKTSEEQDWEEEQDSDQEQEDRGKELDEKVKNFNPSDKLTDQLKQAKIADDVFSESRQNVVRSSSYREALKTISDDSLTEYRDAIARAIVAESISICERKVIYTPIASDATFRDKIIENVSGEIMDSERGFMVDWLGNAVATLATSPAVTGMMTFYVKGKRGVISDRTYPAVGDILLYQGRGGQKIRDYIQSCIKDAEPPVVLLAHSLGGVACVDLLVQQQLDQEVKLLVTVGSQAPYFYEADALQSLEYNKPLPKHFPEWLNIYDLQDFLSFIGGNVFPNKVQDILVDNGQPFPNSHSAYWTNKETWKAIVGRINTL